jgi:hypothetical protein
MQTLVFSKGCHNYKSGDVCHQLTDDGWQFKLATLLHIHDYVKISVRSMEIISPERMSSLRVKYAYAAKQEISRACQFIQDTCTNLQSNCISSAITDL